ncbi:hypothetical protein ACJJTC_017404 [Scirpophaga incertulas]
MRIEDSCIDRHGQSRRRHSTTQTTSRKSAMAVAFILLAVVASAQAWGGLFNRFSSDMLANLGYGRGPYHHYTYGQVEPEDVYADTFESNRISDAIGEPEHCYSAPCATNGDCCRGLICLDTEEGGRCLPAYAGRKLGEICNRENQCDAGLVCEEVVPGDVSLFASHIDSHSKCGRLGRKQYNEDCASSAECDIIRGLCCISCGYFKESLACIGPVATDQIREYVQHTAGEKRIGVYRLH